MDAARLRLDLNDALVPGGFTDAELVALLPAADAAARAVADQHRAGRLAYLGLPRDDAARDDALALAAQLRAEFDTLVVLGIGGSSLGARALVGGLCHPQHNLLPAARRGGMRVFFPDNSDPATFVSLLETLDLPRTAFAAITKSGGTAETLSQLCVIKELLQGQLGADAVRRQIVAITDPGKGALRRIASDEGWRTLPVPPAVGGRFSVFTACGLLPAACAGIDVLALLSGAAAMVERGLPPAGDFRGSPSALLAAVLHAADTMKGRHLHVLMPYADALRDTGDWFVQLWAESLGKLRDGAPVGPTPLRAVGATDQHSLLQLLMEGPEDKFVTFVALGETRGDVAIPPMYPHVPDAAYLGRLMMSRLLDTERRATAMALARRGRPSATLLLPRLDAFHLGELMTNLEIATSVAGVLYGIDPYDQPGVELGKRYTCGILGRPGYEDAAREVADMPGRRPNLVFG
jgi:glucose-6-phosphate isomerase